MRTLMVSTKEDDFVSLKAEPNLPVLGKRLGKSMKPVTDGVKSMCSEAAGQARPGSRGAHTAIGDIFRRRLALTPSQVKQYLETKTIDVAGMTLGEDDLKVSRTVAANAGPMTEANGDGDILVLLDCTNESELVEEGLAREIVNRIQKLRKKVQERGVAADPDEGGVEGPVEGGVEGLGEGRG